MSQQITLRHRRPLPAGERLTRARERTGRSPATRLEWGFQHGDDARRVQAIGEALASPDLYEDLQDFPGLLRIREETILPLGSTLVGESVLIRMDWDMAPGNFTRIELLRAPLPDGRAVYVARGTQNVQVLAATEGEPDEDSDLRFLQALFRTNGTDLRFDFFGSAPTEIEVFVEIDRLALIDLFWAALDAAPEAWEGLAASSEHSLSEDWYASIPPLHDCLLSEDSPLTDLRTIQILEEYLPPGTAARR